MSKYIKLEDVIKVLRDNTMPLDCWHMDRMRAISSLPTIEVSEDCISREYIKGICEDMLDEEMLGHMLGYIENAPSVVPGRAEGEWEVVEMVPLDNYMCSKCGAYSGFDFNYCPHCGAKMKG